MTEEAWKETTPNLVEGYRKISVVQDNPNWWRIEIFDNFGVHLFNLEAMKHRDDNNIMHIKEEGYDSHVTQAYHLLVANNNKSGQRDLVGYLREMNIFNHKIVYQWVLIQCVLAAIRDTRKHP